jgi:hypothetical protein
MEQQLLEKILAEYGPLYLLVVLLLWAMWKGGRWAAEKIAIPLVDSHTGLVDQLRKSDETQTELLVAQSKGQQEMLVTQKQIINTQGEIVTLLKKEK